MFCVGVTIFLVGGYNFFLSGEKVQHVLLKKLQRFLVEVKLHILLVEGLQLCRIGRTTFLVGGIYENVFLLKMLHIFCLSG